MENANRLDAALLRRVCAATSDSYGDTDMMALMSELADTARFADAAKLLDFLALLGVTPSSLFLDTKTCLDKRCKAALRRAALRHSNVNGTKDAKAVGAKGADQAPAPPTANAEDAMGRKAQGIRRQ